MPTVHIRYRTHPSGRSISTAAYSSIAIPGSSTPTSFGNQDSWDSCDDGYDFNDDAMPLERLVSYRVVIVSINELESPFVFTIVSQKSADPVVNEHGVKTKQP